ncbi:MAG: glycosyltransferase [Planctomycetota bacterium]
MQLPCVDEARSAGGATATAKAIDHAASTSKPTPARSSGDAAKQLRIMGLLITDFPGQTHVAMWRLGRAIARRGIKVVPISTKRPTDTAGVHPFLLEAAEGTYYVWPPSAKWVLRGTPSLLTRGWRAIGYLMRCKESGWAKRFKRLPMIVLAAGLAARCRAERMDFLLVHSFAEAAHLVTMSRLLGGPAYGLRLGGDLDVYGVDHLSKTRHAALLVPAAENNADELRDRIRIDDDRLLTTWLGVDADRFGAIERVPPRPGEAVRMLTVARLNYTKGHRYAFQAVRLLADRGVDVRYDVVGSGDYLTTLQTEVAEMGVAERVTFHGAKDEAGVLAALREAHVFVLPSIGQGEASPVALCEAMASGLPAVATVIGGTPQMIADGVDGRLVPQEDGDAIADAVEGLIADPQRWLSVSEAAKRRGAREFDTAIVADRVVGAIERRLAGLPAEEPTDG